MNVDIRQLNDLLDIKVEIGTMSHYYLQYKSRHSPLFNGKLLQSCKYKIDLIYSKCKTAVNSSCSILKLSLNAIFYGF